MWVLVAEEDPTASCCQPIVGREYSPIGRDPLWGASRAHITLTVAVGTTSPTSPLPGDSPVPAMCPTCRYFPPPARHRPSCAAADACVWGCARLINSSSKHRSSCSALSLHSVSFKPRKNCITASACKFLLAPRRVVSTPGMGSLNPHWQKIPGSVLLVLSQEFTCV